MAEGFNDVALNIGMDAIAAACPYMSLHTATPNSSGSNETTAARVATSWSAAANGDLALSAQRDFTGGAAGGPVAAIGLWSASSGGTFRGYWLVDTGDTAFNAAGQYSVVSLAIPGSSS